MRRQIVSILDNQHSYMKESKSQTVFRALLESNLPPQELSPLRLQNEATTIIGAGVETTRWALTVGSFHIINNPEILGKLRAELEAAIPDPQSMPSLERLEKLPYLDACVQECEFKTLYCKQSQISPLLQAVDYHMEPLNVDTGLQNT